MEKKNYQKILEGTLDALVKDSKRPSLLLHACCAPCSSYVLEYLARYFDITVLYYNPNISPADEYFARSEELTRLISEMPEASGVKSVTAPYTPKDFEDIALGLENVPEGGSRCFKCYRLRLEYAARYAKENGFDYFTTTLSISPHKNAEVLNTIGSELADIYGVAYLFSDFKNSSGNHLT